MFGRFGGIVACVGMFASSSVMAAETQAPTGETRPPNVVLIVADDLGGVDLSCYGSKFFQSPRIDGLAKEGVRWTQAYAACPVCSPSRAAIVTGQYPARVHITDWIPGIKSSPEHSLVVPDFQKSLPLELTTIAEHFRAGGYATASIGKWHLGGEGSLPTDHGFETNIGGDNTGHPFTWYAPFKRKPKNAPFMIGLKDVPDGTYLTDVLGDKAVKWIREHREKPFFLYLPHYAVHTPLKAPKDITAPFEAKHPDGPGNNPIYAGMIASMDKAVGKVLDELDAAKLTDNTIVIFTSDNGGLATTPNAPTINAPFREGKSWLYEGGIRIPLIVRWPGKVPAGKTIDQTCSSIDLFPTLAELCGLPKPSAVDGVSVSPALTANTTLPARDLYWHYPHYNGPGTKPGGIIRRGDWKLIEFYETGRRELFNLAKDPGEGRNLAEDEPQRVEELAAAFAAWKRSVNAQEMTPNPNYRPNPPDEKTGVISLHSRTARVFGRQLRYEPLPHKNTLGYWVLADDYAAFPFTVEKHGKYTVSVFQGCGTGSGGSRIEIAAGPSNCEFVVEDTGHFQNFQWRDVGTLEIPTAGTQSLTLKALSKPGVAVGDFRELKLTPVTNE